MHWVSSLSDMRCIIAVSTWVKYLNRRTQRENKIKQQTEHTPTKVFINPWFKRKWRTIGRRLAPQLSNTDAELGQQLSPLITGSKSERYLIQVLNNYEMAKAVVSECHYTDLVNLMLVSKGIRFAVRNSMSNRLLKQNSCPDDFHPEIKNCWGCGNQVCLSCTGMHPIPRDKAFHLQNCSPYCSKCFRNQFCRPRDQEAGSYRAWRSHWLPYTCLGHTIVQVSPEVQSSGSTMSGDQVDVKEELRPMCPLCRNTSWEVIASRRRWRGWKISGGNWSIPNPTDITCLYCQKQIIYEKGLRVWWACRACNSECVEEFHDEEFRAQYHEEVAPVLNAARASEDSF